MGRTPAAATPAVIQPSRDELMKLYVAAMDDYHFQVNLNWSRAQYGMALHAGLIAAAAGIIKTTGSSNVLVVNGIFVTGIMMSAFSIIAVDIGRNYLRPVNDRLKALEQELGISQWGVKTTHGQGGQKQPITVTQLIKFLMVGLAGIDVLGIVYLIAS